MHAAVVIYIVIAILLIIIYRVWVYQRVQKFAELVQSRTCMIYSSLPTLSKVLLPVYMNMIYSRVKYCCQFI